MQELSLNILDIAQNSVRADASLVHISIREDTVRHWMEIVVSDDGCGMTDEQVAHVMDPFFTTRTTRKVGLGVPFFKMSAEATGGTFSIVSQVGVGTTTTAGYHTDHIDMLPLGDVDATILTLITANPQMDFCYLRERDGRSFTLDTRQVREILDGVSLADPEVYLFLKDFLAENEQELEKPA
jgi:anti-sigma regulatory factor (Ser/Thr protein kinase)